MDHLADAPVANILILAGIIFLAVGLFGRIGGFIGSIFGNIEAGKNSRVLAGVLGAILIVGGGWLHEDSHKPVASNPSPAAPLPAAGTTPPSATPAVAPDAAKEAPKVNASTPQPSPKKAPPVAASGAPKLAAGLEKLQPSTKTPLVDDRLVGTWTNLTPRTDSLKRLEIARAGQGLNIHLWYACPGGECDRGSYSLDVSGSNSTYVHADSNRRRVGSLNVHAPGVLLLTVDVFEPGTTLHWHNNWVFVKSTSEKMQAAFSRYLEMTDPKAFAMAPGGSWSYHFKGESNDDAKQKALLHCEQYGMPGCRIILLNDDPIE